jgi:hypothetical protein
MAGSFVRELRLSNASRGCTRESAARLQARRRRLKISSPDPRAHPRPPAHGRIWEPEPRHAVAVAVEGIVRVTQPTDNDNAATKAAKKTAKAAAKAAKKQAKAAAPPAPAVAPSEAESTTLPPSGPTQPGAQASAQRSSESTATERSALAAERKVLWEQRRFWVTVVSVLIALAALLATLLTR